MKECEEPRTREYLMKKFGFNNAPALDYHLNPLREADLLRQRFDNDGKTQTFEQSNLFKRLPKSTMKKILHHGQSEENQKAALPRKASAKN
jgi:hypothetical protein